MSATDESGRMLEELRRRSTYLQVICNSRTPSGALAWSVFVKLDASRSANYAFENLDDALRAVSQWLDAQGAPAPKKKLKLKRRSP